MTERYNTVNEWGNELSISVACRITEHGDEPIMVKDRIPFFSHYREAERFLERRGYSFDRESGRELGVVYECNLEVAKNRFGGRLAAYREMV